MTGPRHALVIGAQCPDLGLLDGLEAAAEALHDTLTAPWVGACEKDPPVAATLLCGEAVARADVEAAVRAAALAAGEAGAVLVVALLGHGMASGTGLCFMASDSRAEAPVTAVDVGSLLAQVLETQGLAGVIAIVDTCHAGNAVPDLKSVANGIRQGDTRLSLLMGSGAAEEAYGLRFSRTLVKVLQDGIPAAGETLPPHAVVEAVREDGGTAGQAILRAEFDGALFAPAGLWLARNARHGTHPAGGLLGPVGAEELVRAVEAVDEPLPVGQLTTVQDLEALRRGLAAASSSPARAWALDVVDGLAAAVRTVGLLDAWPGAPLTSGLLRRTLAAACPGPVEAPPESSGRELLRDAVEYLLLRAPTAGQRRTRPLADFVALLAHETRVDPSTPAVRGWAAALGVGIDLNDAFERLADRTRAMRLRLVVSLHAAVGDEWPESLAVWLLDGGTVHGREEFACAPDRAGVERQVGAALRWASRLAAGMDTPLRRVEVAAPAPLLVQWRPEETDFGMRLGAEYDVVLRWSDRIQPPEDRWWINERARRTLDALESSSDGRRVDWLGESDTRQPQELQARLRSEPRTRAVALEHRPRHLEALLDLLLQSSPIVLWPDDEAHRVPVEARRYLDASWHLLPGEFCRAYRDRWSCQDRTPAAGRGHLAPLRTVWDDPEWLEFCRWFEQSATDGESPA
ncbi:vWA-MoxR associated conflict system protein [Streptomyces kanasensis]|uniref:vWA-MoxR associated conflict system protein n=1 Tax=Streptomyces kanasensis TaxID=936756 RepID=UPI0036F8BB37